jgi:hypothetical protein
MVVILMPRRVWSELGGGSDSFLGRTVEVDGTPQLFQGGYIPDYGRRPAAGPSVAFSRSDTSTSATESPLGQLQPFQAGSAFPDNGRSPACLQNDLVSPKADVWMAPSPGIRVPICGSDQYFISKPATKPLRSTPMLGMPETLNIGLKSSALPDPA